MPPTPRQPQHIVLYGERCSGTKYLQKVLETNFDCTFVNQPEHKHFFGHVDLSSFRDSLFVCIVRAPTPWLNSFYKKPWHLLPQNTNSVSAFLHSSVRSCGERLANGTYSATVGDNKPEITADRHMDTGRSYTSVLQLRSRKLRFVLDDLPQQGLRTVVVRYEDILNSFDAVLGVLRNCGLRIKYARPINITTQISEVVSQNGREAHQLVVTQIPVRRKIAPNDDPITPAVVIVHPDYDPALEARLGYSAHSTRDAGLGYYPMRPAIAASTATSTVSV